MRFYITFILIACVHAGFGQFEERLSDMHNSGEYPVIDTVVAESHDTLGFSDRTYNAKPSDNRPFFIIAWLRQLGPYWLTAFGTILVASVAIFGGWFQRRIWRPKLKFEIDMRGPYCYKIPNIVKRGERIEAFYYSGRVINKGRQHARNVTVFAQSLEKKDEEKGSWELVEEFLPMELWWAHLRDPLTQARFVAKQAIPRNSFAHFDIGHVEPPAITDPPEIRQLIDKREGEMVFWLDTIVDPKSYSNVLLHGDYRLCVIACADNAEPQRQYFLIKNTGQWIGDEREMFTEKLVIKKIQA